MANIIFGALIFHTSFLFINSKGLSSLYEAYKAMGQQPILLNGFLYSQLMVFIFGILYVMAKYYFSSDLNILVPLPLYQGDYRE